MTESDSLEYAPPLPAGPGKPVQVKYWLGVAALVVMCGIVYFPALHGGAIWDDGYSLVDNHNLRDFEGLADTLIRPRSLPVYYPMTFVSFWIEHKLAGLDPNDLFPYHATNIVLQILDAWLLWEVLRRLKVPGAWLIAVIWAIHPVQVESVAWVSERKNTLSAFFLFVSVLIWMRFVGLDPIPAAPGEGEEEPLFALPRDRMRLYLLSLFFFALALLSKSAVITLPPTLLLILWWKRGTLSKKDWIDSIPYWVLAAAMGIGTLYIETHQTGASGSDWDLTVGQKLAVAGRAIWFYADKLFWPHPLSFVYHRWAPSSGLGLVGALLAIGVLVALWMLRGRIGRSAFTAIFYFALTLVPILGFFPFVFQRYSFVADHLQYLACIGIIALVVAGLRRVLALDGIFVAVGAAILIGLGAISWRQSHLYQSAELIWNDVIAKDPDSWMAYDNLGNIVRAKGDPDSLNAAETDFNHAIQLNPNSVEARMNLGLVYEQRMEIPKAIALLKVAQQVSENNKFHTSNDANVYYNLGRLYKYQGEANAALLAFRAAVTHDPRNVPASNAMGAILMEHGDLEHASIWIERTLNIDPEYLPAHTNLGNLYASEGNIEAAMKEWLFVLQRDKNNVVAMDSVGLMMIGMQNYDQAMLWFNRAIAIDPNYALAKAHLKEAMEAKLQAATRPTTGPTTGPTTRSATKAATAP